MYKLASYKALRLLEKLRPISAYDSLLSVITIRKAGKRRRATVLALDYTFAFSRSSCIFSLVVVDCCRLFWVVVNRCELF